MIKETMKPSILVTGAYGGMGRAAAMAFKARGFRDFALDKYAYSLCMELQLKGIKVSVLRAGAVSTDMLGASTDALDRFCQSTTLYSCNAKRFKQIVDGVEARSIAPSRIAEKVARILDKKSPRFGNF